MKGSYYQEGHGTEQPGSERKLRKRRWGEKVPSTGEDRTTALDQAGDYTTTTSYLASFSPTKQ